ncbi:MAG: MFS domain-containing histidine kinase [Victivallales bacterium]
MSPQETGGKRTGISPSEGIILAVLLGIIFFLPIIFSHFSTKLWSELSWRNPVDISMIEWCSAFLNIFLFLLLVEHYRQSGRKILIFMSSGFLVMGLLGFVYALSRPGTETAAWVKGISLVAGGFYFVLGTTARRQTGKDLPRAFIWIIIPSILMACVCAWIPFGLKQILPRILSPSGVTTIFGELFFWIPGALFFFAAVTWLHDYLKNRRKEDIIFTVVILIYAQVALTVRYSQAWGVLWWGWHIGLLVTGIITALYLLILCLRYSLIWRLLLSMGFAFGITVIISSSIMQSYFEKKTNDEVRRRFSVQQRMLLLEAYGPMSFSIDNLQHLMRDFFLSQGCQDDPGGTARMLSLKNRSDWSRYLLETGFYSGEGVLVSSDVEADGAEFRERALLDLSKSAFKNINGRPVFSEFYFDSSKNRWVVAVGLAFKVLDTRKFLFYNVVDVTRLKNRNIVTSSDSRIKNYCGRIIICGRTGKFVECSLPKSYVEKFDSRIPQDELLLSRKLASLFPDTPNSKGRIMQISYAGNDFLVFSNTLPAVDWIVLDVIDEDGIPYMNVARSNYVFESTGMIVLLVGFIVLLLLLNYQLARPLRQIVKATEKLETGDFSARIRSEESNELGIVSNSFDSMVDKLQKNYDELQQTIAERTKALQDAKSANQARTSFFTNVSHELRTPLHGILSFSRLGQDRERIMDGKKVLEYFECINGSAQRLLKMINELLDFAKLESGHMEFVFTETSLFMISLQIYDELKANFEEKKVRFICPKPGIDTNVCIDREKIAMVMRNLIGNGLKFTEPGSELKVSFKKVDEKLYVCVSDCGHGIPETDLDIIFDRFFQSDVARMKGGTGLGLSISKEIIKHHNGTIYASNNKDKGASFTFFVPVSRSPEIEKFVKA